MDQSKKHITNHHKSLVTQEELESNTRSIKTFSDATRISIYEALLIIRDKPDINRQIDNFINPLKLYAHSSAYWPYQANNPHVEQPTNPSPIQPQIPCSTWSYLNINFN